MIPEDWTKTHIILIPKKMNSQIPNDYRLISLCNTMYKIIAKILVNRLKLVLLSLLALEQGAFVLERAIINNILLA